MADPINVPITNGVWTLVATNVTTGVISVKEWNATDFYHTYRLTGNPAPIGDETENTSVQIKSYQIQISSVDPIDVYIFCKQVDGAVVVAI